MTTNRKDIEKIVDEFNKPNEKSEELIYSLAALANNLRKVGKGDLANSLEKSSMNYKVAQDKDRSVHLYNVHKDDLEDMVEFAHDEDVEVVKTKDGLGTVRNIVDRHKEIVDIINRKSTGKLASVVGSVGKLLKVANEEYNELTQSVEFIKQKIDQISNTALAFASSDDVYPSIKYYNNIASFAQMAINIEYPNYFNDVNDQVSVGFGPQADLFFNLTNPKLKDKYSLKFSTLKFKYSEVKKDLFDNIPKANNNLIKLLTYVKTLSNLNLNNIIQYKKLLNSLVDASINGWIFQNSNKPEIKELVEAIAFVNEQANIKFEENKKIEEEKKKQQPQVQNNKLEPDQVAKLNQIKANYATGNDDYAKTMIYFVDGLLSSKWNWEQTLYGMQRSSNADVAATAKKWQYNGMLNSWFLDSQESIVKKSSFNKKKLVVNATRGAASSGSGTTEKPSIKSPQTGSGLSSTAIYRAQHPDAAKQVQIMQQLLKQLADNLVKIDPSKTKAPGFQKFQQKFNELIETGRLIGQNNGNANDNDGVWGKKVNSALGLAGGYIQAITNKESGLSVFKDQSTYSEKTDNEIIELAGKNSEILRSFLTETKIIDPAKPTQPTQESNVLDYFQLGDISETGLVNLTYQNIKETYDLVKKDPNYKYNLIDVDLNSFTLLGEWLGFSQFDKYSLLEWKKLLDGLYTRATLLNRYDFYKYLNIKNTSDIYKNKLLLLNKSLVNLIQRLKGMQFKNLDEVLNAKRIGSEIDELLKKLAIDGGTGVDSGSGATATQPEGSTATKPGTAKAPGTEGTTVDGNNPQQVNSVINYQPLKPMIKALVFKRYGVTPVFQGSIDYSSISGDAVLSSVTSGKVNLGRSFDEALFNWMITNKGHSKEKAKQIMEGEGRDRNILENQFAAISGIKYLRLLEQNINNVFSAKVAEIEKIQENNEFSDEIIESASRNNLYYKDQWMRAIQYSRSYLNSIVSSTSSTSPYHQGFSV